MSLSKMSKALSLAKVAHSTMLRPMSSIASSSFKECLLNTPSTDVTVLANVDFIEPLTVWRLPGLSSPAPGWPLWVSG